MAQKAKSPINVAALSKKYRCDVNRLIRLWKNSQSDYEVSQSVGIDPLKVLEVRQEIASLYERERYQKPK